MKDYDGERQENMCTAIFGHLSRENHIKPKGIAASGPARAYGK